MKINLINFLANEPKWHKHIALVPDHPTPLAMRCQPPVPQSPPLQQSSQLWEPLISSVIRVGPHPAETDPEQQSEL